MLCVSLPLDKDHSSMILGLLECFLSLWGFVISIPKGSVVPTGGKPEWLRFSLVVHHSRILPHTVDFLQDGKLSCRKHAATYPWGSERDTDSAALPPPLFSLLCFFFCRSVSLSCFLPLSVSASSSPSYSSIAPSPSFSPLWNCLRFFFFLLLHPCTWLIGLTKQI